MPLSIRNETAEKLARTVAGETGESLTEAIIIALEERLERLRGRKSPLDLKSRILAISARCSRLPDQDQRNPDEILNYGQHGEPA